jgi:hypothetical protein
MRLAIGYSTKDRPELTSETLLRIKLPQHGDLYWCDGSVTDEGRDMPRKFGYIVDRVTGGADAAIAWKLSYMLKHSPAQHPSYSHIMLLENDVLLDEDWYEPTMNLFREGIRDGIDVGAVSPRSYTDRVLIQRDGYAVMHNIGAGVVVFTREAAEIVLRTFRTHWWLDNVRLFAQLSSVDLRTYAAFRGNEQWVTTDWGWEAQLARRGLASLALTPAKASMIGQNPPLEKQGLELVQWADACRNGQLPNANNDPAFASYVGSLSRIRKGERAFELPGLVHRDGAGMLFFPHQLGALDASWHGTLELQWNQGYGPFAYRAGPGGASLSVHISGSASFQCSGGIAGSIVTIEDHRSGFKAQPSLPPGNEPISIVVPGSVVPRTVRMTLGPGAVFYGLACTEPQVLDTTWKFDWDQLPRAE